LGYIKDKVYVPPLSQSVRELQGKKVHDVVMSVDENMLLHRVWDEIAFKWDVCHVTHGSQIVSTYEQKV
jgi:hypothetical protein